MYLVDDAQRDLRLRIHCADGFREARQAVHAGDEDSVQTPVFLLCQF